MDGLKPSQRKVLYGCLKKRAWDEIKVDQLRGYVSEQTMYAHGDESLNKTIIGMNHNYVGSNNINVLIPCGSFGTRLLGGKDAASPRYISTKINPIVKHIFHSDDSQILTYLHESGYPVEPDYYVPVIPMILVNGANGIGTGFCTDIPTYNPLEICEILMKWLTNGVSNEASNDTNTSVTSQAATLTPWAKNFLGTIEVHTQDSVLTSYTSIGKWHRKDDTTIVITELPLFTWTQDYKQFLDTLIEQAIIDDYLDFTTESVVKFEVSAPRLRIEEWLMEQTIVSIFNLQTRHKINLTCFDAHGQLRHYHTIHDMLRDYYTTRLEYYQKRHAYLDQVYTDEINNLSIKERFIQLVMNEDLVIFKQSKEIVDQQMLEFAFPRRNESYQYLLDTPLHHFTQTYADTLANKILEIQESQNQLRRKSAKDLWVQDLEMFKLNYTP
jgi:DNA topoisomerase-2